MLVLLVAQALPLSNSSSESDMEDEQEEQDQEEEEAEHPAASPSDLGGVPWKEAVELHAKLRGSHGAEGEAGVDTVSGDGELEEEEDDEEEEEEDEEEEDEDSSEGIFMRTFLFTFPQFVSHLNLFSVSFMCGITVSDLSVILSSLSSSVHVLFCLFFYWGICLSLLAEGDYCPWDRELQSGLWLEKHLTDEEDIGTFKGSCSACGCLCSYFGRDI